MRSKAFRIHGKRGHVQPVQFGYGPLPNWKTHHQFGTFRTQTMKPTGVL
jgi:hypothetical protein